MANIDVYLRLVLAVLLGAAVGFERQWHQGMAGVRTNALVALGSALFVCLATLTPDPSTTRVAGQVVTGIGFLGAGVIMRHGLSVTGLNTAATLWCAAGIGVLSGQGFPGPAVAGTVIVVLSNVTLRQISSALERRKPLNLGEPVHYALRVICRAEDQNDVRARVIAELAGAQLTMSGMQCSAIEKGRVEIRTDLTSEGEAEGAMHALVSHLASTSDIAGVHWELAREMPSSNGGNPLL